MSKEAAKTQEPGAGERILIVDDEENMRHMLSVMLHREGYQVTTAPDGVSALDTIAQSDFDVVLCDIRMPRMDGLTFLKKFREQGLSPGIVMMSAYGTYDQAVEALRLGADDYISKPFKTNEILLVLEKLREQRKKNSVERATAASEPESDGDFNAEDVIAVSASMQQVLQTARKIADYKTTVLITGESGTGKELIAKIIHHEGARRDSPFIALNCGAIPENLLESELFGYAKGAFTDATMNKAGLFEEAEGGTLFLDEIGELPLALQVKLLRVLQEEEIRRVGENKSRKVNVRIVAATLRDLGADVQTGRFRQDLFYRLNVLPIHIPPLRERREDIPVLTAHFIEKYSERLRRPIRGLTDAAKAAVRDYEWPGNVRELENVIERAIVLSESEWIDVADLPFSAAQGRNLGHGLTLEGDEGLSIKKWSERIERELIARALEQTGGNRTRAAKLLEISHRALLYKIKEYGIDK